MAGSGLQEIGRISGTLKTIKKNGRKRSAESRVDFRNFWRPSPRISIGEGVRGAVAVRPRAKPESLCPVQFMRGCRSLRVAST